MPHRALPREATLRVAFLPAETSAGVPPAPDHSLGRIYGVALGAALLLIGGTIGWPLIGKGVAACHVHAANQALARHASRSAVRTEWLEALAWDPSDASVRLDLARSYVQDLWLGAAITQCESLLRHPHSHAEASRAYAYLGYCHAMRGRTTEGQVELDLALAWDPSNDWARRMRRALDHPGRFAPLPDAAFVR